MEEISSFFVFLLCFSVRSTRVEEFFGNLKLVYLKQIREKEGESQRGEESKDQREEDERKRVDNG